MYTAFQSNNDSSETEVFSINAPGMREMVDIAALNSRVKFDKTDVPFDQRQILGDATETGLTRFAGRQIADYDGLHKQHPKVFEIPFNSSNKWALVVVRVPVLFFHSRTSLIRKQLDKPHAAGRLTLYIKGAPERVLAKCSTYLKDGQMEPMSDEFKAAYDEAYNVCLLPSSLVCMNLTHIHATVHGIPWPSCHSMCTETLAFRRVRHGLRFFEERRQLPERGVLFLRPDLAGGPSQTRCA